MNADAAKSAARKLLGLGMDLTFEARALEGDVDLNLEHAVADRWRKIHKISVAVENVLAAGISETEPQTNARAPHD